MILGGAISKIPAASPRRFMPNPNDNVVSLAGLSQRDVVLSQRAEEQLEQEKRDEELAKRLQQQISLEETEDAITAQEAQDLEYAKMIHNSITKICTTCNGKHGNAAEAFAWRFSKHLRIR